MFSETTIKTEYQVFRFYSDGPLTCDQTDVFESIEAAQAYIDSLCSESCGLFTPKHFQIVKRFVVHTFSEWVPISPEDIPPKKPTKKLDDIDLSKKPKPKPYDMSIFPEYKDPEVRHHD